MPSWGRVKASGEGLTEPLAPALPSHSPLGPRLRSRITLVVEHPISIDKEDLEGPQGSSGQRHCPSGRTSGAGGVGLPF